MTTVSPANYLNRSHLQGYPENNGNNSSPVSQYVVKDKVSLSGESSGNIKEKNENLNGPVQLGEDDLRILESLKKRDREVRTHEQAHLAAAGRYAGGGAHFTTQKGPDGRAYAVSGEVPIDVSTENSPEATISKMETIKRAALAPQNPSSADRRIAAQAAVKEAAARKELLLKTQEVLLDSEKDPSLSESSSNTQQNTMVIQMALSRYETIAALQKNPT
ncbi:putative metalloprotease CJM1_0395 family protein [Desulfomarina sp.]